MARNCNCAGQTCGCLVVGGVGIEVSGQGTASNPFTITNVASDLSAALEVADTSTVNLTLSGGGTNLDPFILSANATLKLQQLTDVNNPGGNPVAGQVPVYVGVSGTTGHWEFQTPATAAAAMVPFVFSQVGTLSVNTGTHRIYNDTGRTLTIDSIRASAGTAPTGSALIVDVHKDGTTLFSTQSKRPQIAVGTNTDLADPPDVTTIANGSYLTVDVDQVGSTIAGASLTVAIWAH